MPSPAVPPGSAAEEKGSVPTAADAEADLESSDFDVALGDGGMVVEEESGSEVVALDEEEDEGGFEGLREEGAPAAVEEDEECAAVAPSAVVRAKRERASARKVGRYATVRYYSRMNPQRMFPLLVVVADRALMQVDQEGVGQRTSGRFQVARGSVVEVEPVLPGCACYPPREQVRIGKGEATATFWVVPQVLGTFMEPRVVLRQDHRILADIPLRIKVVKRTMAVVMGVLTLVLPFLSTVLKHFRLDFETQLKEDFGLYAQAADLALSSLSSEGLAGLLLAGTVGFYLWSRPGKRDLFWDLTPATPEELFRKGTEAIDQGDERRGGEMISSLLNTHPEFQPAWLYFAEWHYVLKDYASALECYEQGLALGKAEPPHYLHAAVAAGRLRHPDQALAILREAQKLLPPSGYTKLIWYNMGCYAIRLGNLDEGVGYLKKAVEAGYKNVQQLQSDRDLKPVRGRAEFLRLLGKLKR